MRYEQAKASGSAARGGAVDARNLSPEERQQRRAQFGGVGGFPGGRRERSGDVVIGAIIVKDAMSMTVKLRDGGSKIVLIPDRTEIGKTVAGTVDDLTVDAMVVVNGTGNADGSFTAQTIQIRPAGADRTAPAP